MTAVSRRRFLSTAAAATASASVLVVNRRSRAAESDVRFDFTRPLDGWESVTGKWGVEDVAGSSKGKALVQRATSNDFNVIVAPGGPWADTDISARFKPISGSEDASAGIVFRFSEGRYYVIRANALEDNFNLYFYDRGRRQLASSRVKAPALGQWHKLRISAEGDRFRGWLNDQQLIDHRDNRFASGRIGLWTKADSITAFDELVISPIDRR
jgi:Domain of Unknown Function (DUF1080)